MKKISALILILLFCVPNVHAEENWDFGTIMTKLKLQDLKQGIGYSFIDSQWNYMFTKEAIKYKGFTFEFGYSSTDKIIAVASYQIIALKDYMEVPLIEMMELNLGVYGGFGRVQIGGGREANNEFDTGVSITLVKLKF